MAIDITKLSSEELFELARKRQQEEQSEAQRAALKERLTELKKMRGLILSKHDEALAGVDKAIAELQKKRTQLISEHEEALSGIDKEMQDLNAKLENAPAAATPPAAAPVPAPTPAAPKPAAPVAAPPVETPAASSSSLARKAASEATPEEIMIHVRELMLGRSYISESLLKEQLRARKVNVSNLHKQIEELVRDGKLASKGGGNYALGKKA